VSVGIVRKNTLIARKKCLVRMRLRSNSRFRVYRRPPVLVSQNECDNPARVLTVGVPCPICQGSEASSAVFRPAAITEQLRREQCL
jgi:hypothetical protein